MRNASVIKAAFPVLVCLAAAMWLLWAFLPLPGIGKGILTVIAVVLSGWRIRLRWRRQRPTEVAGDDALLPPDGFTGPVLLMCGDTGEGIFSDGPRRVTSQGCWLQVGDTGRLKSVAERLTGYRPLMAGQLTVVFHCLPDKHRDEAQLRAAVKGLRHQIRLVSAVTGYPVPLILSCAFSGPETPWIVVRGNTPLVCTDNEPALALDDWQALPGHTPAMPFLSQSFAFIQQVIMDELTKPDRLCATVAPFAVALRCGSSLNDSQTIWSQWLFRHTRLLLPLTDRIHKPRWHFADPVLPLLMPYVAPLQGGKTGRRVVLFLLICALMAMGISLHNNRQLISKTGADLARWLAIPMTHYVPKAQALARLNQDALLLERWQRQGEPHRYGLGFYPGQRLWLAVQQAIDTYVPPPPPPKPKPAPKPVPKIIRLDSMSLFDSGKAVLKAGSTKWLVNSLVGIKAKPGWLIVVAGHTDNTGSAQLNQMLSQKRAEAVRDWMRDTGDVPESCFAVQGYGASRPVATNDTPEGRALNRRVEISLVPQANACQLPGQPSASSQDDGASQHNGE
ncbi:TPA: OmpA family protein [Enterobacter hormaechei subsp. steigerwaltii]|nr:OmpA family protein [Enterobacter hormaechei subsp. steigerwaltii]